MGTEHTAASGEEASPPAAVPGLPIIERKHKPDGSVREYPCTLVHLVPGLAVVRFPIPAGGNVFATPITVPPGSISDGYFWRRRPYNLYRMRGPDGAIVAHRIDAVTDVRIDDGVLAYRDLILDWWVLPDGELLEEDRDEFDAALASGLLPAADRARAEEAARQVFSRYRHIIDEAAAIEQRFEASV